MTDISNPPNILFLFPDQWRWDWLGCHDGSDTPYGNIPVNTPHIDRLAARGTRFTRCYTNSPVCSPARACLAQGVRYERCGVPSNKFNTPGDADTVFKRLRDAGYRTAISGKADLQKQHHYKGLDGWTPGIGQLGFVESANQCGKWDAVNSGADRPVDPYMASLYQSGLAETHKQDFAARREFKGLAAHPTPLPRQHYTDDFCGSQALGMLERWPVDHTGDHPAPWMLWVNFPGPHEPFDPPRCLQERYDDVDFPGPINWPDDARPQDHEQLRRNYAAMCEGIDEWVGRLIAQIESRGELDNTLVVFASDHGELLGDHGKWFKSHPEEASVHVPLIVAGPGIEEGTMHNNVAELIDISATLLTAAGLEMPNNWDARPLPTHGGPPREHACSALNDWTMVVTDQHKLITREDGSIKLFDLHADPGEMQDIAADEPETVAALRALLPRDAAAACVGAE